MKFFGVEWVESSPRSYAQEFRSSAPLFSTLRSITFRYCRPLKSGQLHVFSCRHCCHAPAIPHPFKGAAAAVQTLQAVSHTTHSFIAPQNTRCGCSDVLSRPHPSFISPNTLCGCPNLVLHPVVYHTSLEAPASCTYHRGYTRPHPPQDTTPGDSIISSPKCCHRGVLSCVILQSNRSHDCFLITVFANARRRFFLRYLT